MFSEGGNDTEAAGTGQLPQLWLQDLFHPFNGVFQGVQARWQTTIVYSRVRQRQSLVPAATPASLQQKFGQSDIVFDAIERGNKLADIRKSVKSAVCLRTAYPRKMCSARRPDKHVAPEMLTTSVEYRTDHR